MTMRHDNWQFEQGCSNDHVVLHIEKDAYNDRKEPPGGKAN